MSYINIKAFQPSLYIFKFWNISYMYALITLKIVDTKT